MRWRSLSVELLLLAFLAVFLVYPLVYVVPGSASDVAYEVRLLAFGDTSEQKAQAAALLSQANPDAALTPRALRLPYPVRSFPSARAAEALAKQLQDAGAQAEVVPQRNWTTFY